MRAPATPLPDRRPLRRAWPELQLPGGIGEARTPDPTWCVELPADVPPPVAETMLSLSDGLIGTRGVLEDSLDPGDDRAVAVAGLYDADPTVGERLVSLPSWCELPRLVPGIGAGRRVLDLRDGLLLREAGRDAARVTSVRFACLERPGTGILVWQEHGVHPEVAVPAVSRTVATRAASFGGGVAIATDTSVRGWAGLVIERTAVHVVGGTTPPSRARALRDLEDATALGPAELLAGQRDAWARHWDAMDAEIIGDPSATLAARFALFHLVSSCRRSRTTAIGARGLTGAAYAGHVFWDTDVFVLPVLAAVDRKRARGVLGYRLQHLDAARSRAAQADRAGARFPWESAATGRDVTPDQGIDQHGDVVPITTGELEEHITADVAWAAWQYASWGGDWRPLTGYARDLLIDGARYWNSRVRWDAGGRAHLDGVTGPDEYHEHVDDNAFTNLMARWHLRRAAEVVSRLAEPALAEEAEDWTSTADGLVDNLQAQTLLYEQFSGYDRLEPRLVASLGTPPIAADLALGAAGVAATQIIKQADVLMAHALVPEETAGASLGPNLAHYLARTAHGSSLSPSIHARLLARAGRPDEALHLLRLAAAVDFENLTETTSGGLHLANLGGLWQALVHGFAGVEVRRPDDRAFVLGPSLPEPWKELRFRVTWHGRRLAVACRHDRVDVGCDRPLVVELHGTRHHVEPPGRSLP